MGLASSLLPLQRREEPGDEARMGLDMRLWYVHVGSLLGNTEVNVSYVARFYKLSQMLFLPYFRLSRSCHKKCIPPKYHEGELTKGEAICLDRCVAKFMEVHDRIGKKLMTSMQDEGAMKQMAGPQR